MCGGAIWSRFYLLRKRCSCLIHTELFRTFVKPLFFNQPLSEAFKNTTGATKHSFEVCKVFLVLLRFRFDIHERDTLFIDDSADFQESIDRFFVLHKLLS